MKVNKLAPILGALLLALAACGCNKLKARDHLNKGVQDYKNAQFQTAVMHFKEAVRLDPTLLNARLFLATSYVQQYVPGGESPENLNYAQLAIDSYKDVLKMDPSNITALASIAQINYSMKKFDESKKYNEERIKVEPDNPEPYYWIGVLDWAVCFPRAQKLRVDNDIVQPGKDGELPPIPEKFRKGLAEQNGPLVEEGLNALNKAIQLKPNDVDAMAYLNLMYRQKAEIDEDKDSREADLKQADDWVNKNLAARKAGTASGSSETAPAAAQ